MARKLKGIAAAPGIAIAPVVHFHTTLDQIPTRKIADEHLEAEKSRLVGAIESVTGSLTDLQKELAGALGKHDVRIYDAQLAILHDKTFIKEIEGEIDQRKCNLEVALQRVVARYESAFEKMENAAMRERAADLRDIGRQLVGALVARGRQIYTADRKSRGDGKAKVPSGITARRVRRVPCATVTAIFCPIRQWEPMRQA